MHQVGDLDRAHLADLGHVVAQQVDDHQVLADELGLGLEPLGGQSVRVGIGVA